MLRVLLGAATVLLALLFTASRGYAASAPNDACAGATVLALGTPVADGFAAATESALDPCGNGPGVVDLWYRFTATATAHDILVDEPAGTNSGLTVSVFSGSCAPAGGLTAEVCAFASHIFATGLTPDGEYFVQVQSPWGAPAAGISYSIVVNELPAAPANDEATAATALTVGGAAAAGTLYGATDSGNDVATPGTNDEDDDVYFRFYAPASGKVDVALSQLAGSDPFPAFSLLAPGTSGGYVLVGDEQYDQVESYAGLTGGGLYYVQVYSSFTDRQSTSFEVAVAATPGPPANDACASAAPLAVGDPAVAGTLASATPDGVDGCATGNAHDDVWYAFTATHADHALYYERTAGPFEGIEVAVYGGACGSLVNVGCGDAFAEALALSGLTVGADYRVQVHSAVAAGNQAIEFALRVVAPPANATCATAAALDCGVTLAAQTTRGATGYVGAGACASGDGFGRGVYYSFVGTGGDVTLTATPATAADDLALVVEMGGCAAPTHLACADAGFAGDAESVTLATLAGEVYRVAVAHYDAFGSAAVDFALEATCAALPPIAAATGCAAGAVADLTGSGDWLPITLGVGLVGKILDSEPLGATTINFYGHAGASLRSANHPYADRNVSIDPAVQPSATIRLRLYFSAAEIDALIAADPTVSAVSDLAFTKFTGASCSATLPPGARVQLATTAAGHYGADYFVEATTAAFSEFFLGSSAAPLPAELVAFDAVAGPDHNELTWTTASERGVEYFAVERSADGGDFAPIGTRDAAGQSTRERRYALNDERPLREAYYRIAAYDLDGSVAYSEVVFVERPRARGGSFAVTAWPNPAAAALTLRVSGVADGDPAASAELYDATGARVLHTSLTDERTLDVGQLPRGLYTLRARSGARVDVRRIVLQ